MVLLSPDLARLELISDPLTIEIVMKAIAKIEGESLTELKSSVQKIRFDIKEEKKVIREKRKEEKIKINAEKNINDDGSIKHIDMPSDFI
jgi:hypothetical protein